MSVSKIKSLNQLKKIVMALKRQGKKIVFTNGCFDLLHYGHIKYLQDARKKGDVLIVALNSDSSVRRIKGKKRPIVNEKDRLKIVAALESVNYVLLFKEDTPLKVIKSLKPDIIVKGADWKMDEVVGRSIVSSYGGKVSIVRFIKGHSTTNLINKIAENY
jgi:D-beta-D-heptose 7-phosphate kinase/D-beta-D-heptose 1-phosphate adenosyltransferase